jgi:copper transport protein
MVKAGWLLLALLIGAATLSSARDASPVEAHALLVRADPPVNERLREPPRVLTLYFSEPLERRFSGARVVDQEGARVDDRVEFDDADNALMRVYLQPLKPGYITVNWETVSTVDGHRITGSYPLTILNEDGSLPAGSPPDSAVSGIAGEDPQAGRVVTKWFMLVSASLLVGALGFVAYVLPALPGDPGERARDTFHKKVLLVAGAAVVVLAAAGIFELIFQAVDLDTGIGSVIDTEWGERWLVRNLILLQPALIVIVLAFGWARSRLLAYLALVGAAAYLAVTSSVSHAGAGGGSFWAVASDFVHLLASSVWIGMLGLLVMLFFWARRSLASGPRYTILRVALVRFSIAAMLSVAALLFTGTFNAIVQFGRVADLVETDYGLALLAKLLLLVPLLLIAGYNAYLLRPDFAEAAEGQGTRGRQGILEELESQLNARVRWELGVALAVLAVVAVLVQMTPTRGRIADPSDRGDYLQTREAENIEATLRISPNQPGINTFEVYLAGGIDVVEGLRLEFGDPGGFANASRLEMEPSNPPTFYLGQGPFLASAGTWNIVLNIRRSAGTDLRPSYQVEVPEVGIAASTPRSGGSFDSPVSLTTGSVALLAVSGAASLFIIFGSISRPNLPEGYLGWLAAELAYRAAPLNVRPVWTLAALIVGGIIIGYVVGTHTDRQLSREEASRENPIPASAESIARGQMLFNQNCTICHGETGRGDGPAAASLPLQPANLYDHVPYHPDTFFFGAISKGVGGVMPAFENILSEEDRWNILNYLRATFTEEPVER